MKRNLFRTIVLSACLLAPCIMTITGVQNQRVSIPDVLVRDVCLCSGQSNMEMGMIACEAAPFRTDDWRGITKDRR